MTSLIDNSIASNSNLIAPKLESSNVKNMIIEFSNNEITFTNLWNTLTKEEKMKYDNDISKANKEIKFIKHID